MPFSGYGSFSTAVITPPSTSVSTIVAASSVEGAVWIKNVGTITVYLGPHAVTGGGNTAVSPANGYPLMAGETLMLPAISCAVYGIVARGTGGLRVMRFNGG